MEGYRLGYFLGLEVRMLAYARFICIGLNWVSIGTTREEAINSAEYLIENWRIR